MLKILMPFNRRFVTLDVLLLSLVLMLTNIVNGATTPGSSFGGSEFNLGPKTMTTADRQNAIFIQGQKIAFTNDDVLKMVKAGFSDDTIVEAIRTNEPRFDTSSDALFQLKQAGVSERVISTMLIATRDAASTSGGRRESDGLPGEPGVYILKDGRYVELAIEMVDWKSKFFSPISTTGGLTTSRLTAQLNAPQSRLQLAGDVELLIVCPDGVAATEYQLLRADLNKDKREFRVDFKVLHGGVLEPLGGIGRNAVGFEAKRLAAGQYRIQIRSLDKGEYAFLPPGVYPGSLTSKMYTFGLH